MSVDDDRDNPALVELGRYRFAFQIYGTAHRAPAIKGILIIDTDPRQFANIVDWMKLYTHFRF